MRVWGSAGMTRIRRCCCTLMGLTRRTTITDSNAGGSAKTWTAAGNAQIDTAQAKFGGGSLLVDGTLDAVRSSVGADCDLGTGDFTIDCWFNCTAAAGPTNICGRPRTRNCGMGNSQVVK